MNKTISKDPSAFLRVRVEIPEPVKEIQFTPANVGCVGSTYLILFFFHARDKY